MGALIDAIGRDLILSISIVFCRIGACIMIMPGLSSARIPVRPRLFLAFGISIVLLPLLAPEARTMGADVQPLRLVQMMVSETLAGLMIGTLGRMFFLALETMAAAMAYYIGLSSNLGTAIDESLPLPALATLFTLTATMLIFAGDQHYEMLRGLASSYKIMPMGAPFSPQFALVQLVDTMARAFLIALQVSGPFVIYAIVVNLALGLVNKVTPQVPVYFISLPFVVAGGVFLLFFTIRQILFVFMTSFSQWLVTG